MMWSSHEVTEAQVKVKPHEAHSLKVWLEYQFLFYLDSQFELIVDNERGRCNGSWNMKQLENGNLD